MRRTEQFVQLCYLLSCPTHYFSFICCWLFTHHWLPAGWLGSRVVSVLDSGAEGPGFKSQSGNSLRQTVHNHCASVHQAAKLVAALLRVAGVTAGLVESNRLPPGLWLTSPAGWLPRTGISSGNLRSVIDYWLPFYWSPEHWLGDVPP